MCVALGKHALRSGHYVFRGAPQFFGKASQELKVAPCETFRTAAADKFDAPILADFRAAADKEHADLPGALDVRAAAGLQISRLYFDSAKDAVPLDFFSHAELRQQVRGTVAYVDRAILEDNLICSSLSAFKNFLGRFRAPQINGVDDFVLSIADIDDVGFTQLAEVVRLASGSGIEGGLIQDDFPSWRFGHW